MSGRKPTVDDEAFLQAIDNSDAPVASTTEIQEPVGFSTTKGARDRLMKLKRKGFVEVMKVGRSQAWWLTDEGRAAIDESGDS